MKGSEPELSSLAKRLSKNRGLVSLLTSDCKILVIDSNEAVGLWDTTAKTVRDYVLFEAKINRIVVRVDRLRFRVDELSHELNLIYDQVSSIAFSPKKISA